MKNERDIIQDYFNGRLSDAEKMQFEQSLQANPNLSEEFNSEKLYRDLFKQIGSQDLKAQMSGIKLNPNNFRNKIITAAALVLLASGVTLFWINQRNHNNSVPIIQNNTSETEKPTEAPIANNTISNKTETTKSSTEVEKRKTTTLADLQPKTQTTIKSKSSDLDESTPQEFDISDENTSNNSAESLKGINKIDVVVEKGSENELMYKFVDSKLFLLGNFNKQYEIVHLGTQEIYLKYNNSYYYIRKNIETPTKLEKVTNQNLIKKIASALN
ncbi:MAG: hypothetical protein U0V72_14805 [Cytophagales bacterium]